MTNDTKSQHQEDSPAGARNSFRTQFSSFSVRNEFQSGLPILIYVSPIQRRSGVQASACLQEEHAEARTPDNPLVALAEGRDNYLSQTIQMAQNEKPRMDFSTPQYG
jgi:hypothetical protein